MKRCIFFIALIMGLSMWLVPQPATSQDTSPYLLGVWETGVFTITTPVTTRHQATTEWQIINPTSKSADVYAVLASASGQFFACRATTIPPNGVGRIETWWNNEPFAVGTVKFFAFPPGKKAFDPNAVIGGFQDKRRLAEAPSAITELFFSEYVEGSSYNKALEIYNGTGSLIDLQAGGYKVEMYFNGNQDVGLTVALTGTVASGDVYVLAHGGATNPTILAEADQLGDSPTVGWFNGDDAVVLKKGDTILDVIGQIAFDPGSEWGSNLTSTQDNTLRRKPNITGGDPDGSNAFDPSVEWEGFAQDTVDGLGSHTVSLPELPPRIISARANLKATAINSYTLGEFARIPFSQCTWDPGWAR